MNRCIVAYICILIILQFVNYYAAEEKPFRIQKLNLVWDKASKKLSKEKLKSLYTDLKYQDKEELSWKKLRAENLDKNGLKESMVQGSFNAILVKYDLLDDFKTLHDSVKAANEYLSTPQMKIVFRDKKLNKLWLKAEQQGFTDEQLDMLKQEFHHHQSKIDQYYQLMEKVNEGSWHEDDPSNTISQAIAAEEGKKKWKSEGNPHQALKEKHSELKAGYDYLTSKVIPNLKNMEFDEPQVNSLWEMAKNASFSDTELESLRGELHHFEHRIKKYKHLSELEMNKDSQNNVIDAELAKRQKRLKEYEYKVDKIKTELADRIIARHSEL